MQRDSVTVFRSWWEPDGQMPFDEGVLAATGGTVALCPTYGPDTAAVTR
ncbi:hypothetical protein AB0F72_19510 [Actinoplanes sp. NPDC023936]